MKRIHIAISVGDIASSVEDYSRRLGCQPCIVVPNEYALWRTDTVNFSVRQTVDGIGVLRHLGWEDSASNNFTKEVDTNGITWEAFSPDAQATEIKNIWPHANYSVLKQS
jgi:hypothetical protein